MTTLRQKDYVPAPAPQPELPSVPEAEAAVLGSILMRSEALTEIVTWLSAAHFFDRGHMVIYSAMVGLFDANKKVDFQTVVAELRRLGQLDAVGGVSYLADLPDRIPSSYGVVTYATDVLEAAELRALVTAGGQVGALAWRKDLTVEEAKAEAVLIVQNATERQGTDDVVMIDDSCDIVYNNMTSGVIPSIPTGYRDIDQILGGLGLGDLVILAARPGTGKTSFALSLAHSVAAMDRPVFIASMEMGHSQLTQRFLSMDTGIDLHQLRNHLVRDENLELLANSIDKVRRWPIGICDMAGQTPQSLRARVLRFMSKYPEALIIVDYLQLMSGKRSENRVQEVSDISRRLKNLAREINTPILALSQLSRAVENRSSHVPMLSDLRESGSLEQDADVVMFLYREEMYEKETDKKGIAELHIGKQRNGPVGVVPLRFDAQTTHYKTLTYRTPEGY